MRAGWNTGDIPAAIYRTRGTRLPTWNYTMELGIWGTHCRNINTTSRPRWKNWRPRIQQDRPFLPRFVTLTSGDNGTTQYVTVDQYASFSLPVRYRPISKQKLTKAIWLVGGHSILLFTQVNNNKAGDKKRTTLLNP